MTSLAAVVPTPSPQDPLAPLGAHVSVAGGLPRGVERAAALGATALQLFTKPANRWAERQCERPEVAAFRQALAATAIRVTVSHDSYLINAASPDPLLRARSLDSYAAELERCAALGIDLLVSHPGNYMDERMAGLGRNLDGVIATLERVPTARTRLCLEMTAGQGTVLGATFEEMAWLLDRIPAHLRARVGCCVDTCHIFAAGYDLANDYDGVWARFGDTVGFERLAVLHLNDSKFGCGSHRDRHELIGEGAIGEGAFQRVMTDPRLATVPKIIETPKGDDATAADRRMLERLRRYRDEAAGA